MRMTAPAQENAMAAVNLHQWPPPLHGPADDPHGIRLMLGGTEYDADFRRSIGTSLHANPVG